MGKYIKKWTPEMENLLGTKPDKKLAILWSVPTKIITNRRNKLRIRAYPAKLNEQLFKEDLRICYKCGETKPLSEFKKHPGCYEGLMTQCKECEQAKRRKRRQRHKLYWIDKMGRCCARCGYNECSAGLDFHHHITNNGVIDKPSSWIVDIPRAKYELAYQELNKCVLLCSCCHAGLHSKQLQIHFIKRDGLGWTVANREVSNDQSTA